MKHLVPQFIIQKAKAGTQRGTFPAYAMFLDISGFTNLTEYFFQLEGREGGEVMSRILNNIFAPLVAQVYQKGGFIPYFAGDAFTGIFPADGNNTASSIARMALDIQGTFEDWNEVYKGEAFPMRLKIGLSYGNVDWSIIGDRQKTFYFQGQAIDDAARAEHLSQVGEVIADHDFIQRCKASPTSPTFSPLGDGFAKVLDAPLAKIQADAPQLPEAQAEDLYPFLPKSVVDYAGPGEFRDVVSVFLAFKDIPERGLFDEFATMVREQFHHFSGYFKEVDFGDKGGVMVGFFGAPLTFGDNEERALEFAFSLKKSIAEIQKKSTLQYKAGITSGLSLTGIIGGKERCQYAVIGNAVNLAARLMVYANWGDILVGPQIQKTKGYLFQPKGDIIYKGFKGPIATYSLLGHDKTEDFYSGEMIGRKAELDALTEFAQPVFRGGFAGVAVIYGEAGIGKSRLAYETRMRLKGQDRLDWHSCQADQILQKPFNPFVYLFRGLFEQSPERSYEHNKQVFEERFDRLLQQCDQKQAQYPDMAGIIKELRRTQTVIAARLGLYYPNSLWTQLDAQGRYQNTITSFINLLQAEAIITPYVLEVEDGHWFDESTKALLGEFVQAMQNYPACLIITSRYNEQDGTKPQFFATELPENTPWLELDLNVLSPDSIAEFALSRLGGRISPALKNLLARTTNGNPFYTEQVLEYFIESQLLEKQKEGWSVKDENVRVSGSINAVLMARIDRLSGLVKETVKAAAVIGREFEVQVLSEVMKAQREFMKQNGDTKSLLEEQIHEAEKGQIWKAVNEIRYIFKHSLLREAVYDMQIRTRLRELHKLIAETIERVYATQIENRYADLAFHYEQAEEKAKMDEYLEKAGDYAKENYNNGQAIVYYDKLAQSLDRVQQQPLYVKTLLKKAGILTLTGEWVEAERVLSNALALAASSIDKVLLGRTNNDLGHLLMLKGDYTEAYKYLQVAAAFFEEAEDGIGLSKSYGHIGDVFFRQGEYEKAKDYFKESLRIGQQTERRGSHFGIVSNLGLALMNQGQYEEAIAQMKPYLEQCEREGNKLGVANTSIYLGIVYFEQGDNESAMECYQKGLKECEELGNKFLTAIALGCMGKVLVVGGHFDTALELYERDLKLCRELGDKQGTSITLGLLGDLEIEIGDFDKALKYLEEQLRLSEELNYQKGIASALGSIADALFHKKDYAQAQEKCVQAIAICKEIDNKRLHVLLLLQMVELSLHTAADLNQTLVLSKEADMMADELGNPELIFQTSVRRAQVEIQHGDRKQAQKNLLELLTSARNPHDKGEIYFILASTPDLPQRAVYRQEGYQIYKALYQKTPRHDYRVRMEALATAMA